MNGIARYQQLCARFPQAFGPECTEAARRWAALSPAEQAGLGVVEEHPRWLWVREQGPDGPRERPVYLDPRLEKQIEDYFALMETRPELFRPSELYPICTDRRMLLAFEEETGRPAGLVFDNLPYYQPVADLILGEPPYLYGRVVYPDPSVGGTVMVPLLETAEGPGYGLLQVYRHSIRGLSGGEFPRGYQCQGISPEENAKKELWEELAIYQQDAILRPDYYICAGARVMDFAGSVDLDKIMMLMEVEMQMINPSEDVIIVGAKNSL